MLIIRMSRTGRVHKPFYRIVVAEKQKSVSKKFLYNVGTFDPAKNEFKISDKANLEKYLKLNVELSDTVKALLTKNGYLK